MTQIDFLFLLIVGTMGFVFGYTKGIGKTKEAINLTSYQHGALHILQTFMKFLDGNAVVPKEPSVKVLAEIRSKLPASSEPMVVQLREAKRIYELILSTQSTDVPYQLGNLQRRPKGHN